MCGLKLSLMIAAESNILDFRKILIILQISQNRFKIKITLKINVIF